VWGKSTLFRRNGQARPDFSSVASHLLNVLSLPCASFNTSENGGDVSERKDGVSNVRNGFLKIRNAASKPPSPNIVVKQGVAKVLNWTGLPDVLVAEITTTGRMARFCFHTVYIMSETSLLSEKGVFPFVMRRKMCNFGLQINVLIE
jgi:hypothetical protein